MPRMLTVKRSANVLTARFIVQDCIGMFEGRVRVPRRLLRDEVGLGWPT
jgi:hypothetical protein